MDLDSTDVYQFVFYPKSCTKGYLSYNELKLWKFTFPIDQIRILSISKANQSTQDLQDNDKDHEEKAWVYIVDLVIDNISEF